MLISLDKLILDIANLLRCLPMLMLHNNGAHKIAHFDIPARHCIHQYQLSINLFYKGSMSGYLI